MLNNISNQIAKRIVRQMEQNKSMEDIYTYGLELIFSTYFGISSILFLSLIFKEIGSGIVFICFFAPLRMFTGGYHANTYKKCFFISNIIYAFTLTIKKYSWQYISPNFLILSLILVGIYIYFKAPIICKNQNINIRKQLRSKKIATTILIVQIIFIFHFNKRYKELVCMAVFSIYLVALLMLISDKSISKMINKRRTM